jgi:hypothetical protein
MSHATIHVRPRADGAWVVEAGEHHDPLSTHDDATAAAAAATRHADEHDVRVIVHDRYNCTRVIRHGAVSDGHVPSSGCRS